MAFATLKALLRDAKERSIPALLAGIGERLDRFDPAECAAYFSHAGYQHSKRKCSRRQLCTGISSRAHRRGSRYPSPHPAMVAGAHSGKG